jgi:hypothetical protein
MAKWLVAVDDSVWASYAYNYVTTYANKETDRVYLMHVTEEVQRTYIGYATPSLLENLRKVQEEKARKILVHYGHKCQELGVSGVPVTRSLSS